MGDPSKTETSLCPDHRSSGLSNVFLGSLTEADWRSRLLSEALVTWEETVFRFGPRPYLCTERGRDMFIAPCRKLNGAGESSDVQRSVEGEEARLNPVPDAPAELEVMGQRSDGSDSGRSVNWRRSSAMRQLRRLSSARGLGGRAIVASASAPPRVGGDCGERAAARVTLTGPRLTRSPSPSGSRPGASPVTRSKSSPRRSTTAG